MAKTKENESPCGKPQGIPDVIPRAPSPSCHPRRKQRGIGEGNKRAHVLVEPGFQLRVALWGGVIAVAEIAVTGMVMTTMILTSVWIPAGYHVGMFYKLVAAVGIAVLFFTALNMALAIVLSHRIAGPVYRLKQSMRRMATGDISFLVRLRETDELQDLKDEFNDMISSVRDRVATLREEVKTKRGGKSKKEFPFVLD